MQSANEKEVAAVVGVGSGLGAALARRFAAGYKTVLIARSAAVIKPVAEEIRAAGGIAVPLQSDATIEEQISATHEKIRRELGPIEILIYNGGWMAVSTPTGRIVCRVESDPSMRHGLVALPHGYGQSYPDGAGGRIVDGPRLNLITAHDDCDPIAATPYHKNVAVHLAPVVGVEVDAAEAAAARVHAVAAA